MKAATNNDIAEALDPMPAPEQRFYSVGATCQHLGCNPGQLRVLMETAGVRFAELRDGVPYFNGAGFAKVVEQQAAILREIETVASSAANN